jgi:hypothetical protein
MARIIIGSSSVRRFYSHTKFNAYQPYKMELCTVNRMFEVTMESIPDEARVIVSVIENFIEKEIKDKDEAGKIKSLEEVMKNFIETVVRVAKKKKDAKFVLAYPLLRPAHKWMIDNDERITREFERAFNRQDQANISKAMTGGASGSSGTSGPSRGGWPRGGRARGGTPGMGRGGGKKRPMEETDTEESSRAKKR